MTSSHAEVGVVLARAGTIDVGLQQVSFSRDWSRLKDIFSKRMLYLNSSALLDILITKVMLLCDVLSYFHITCFIHKMYVCMSWVILCKEILLSVTMFFSPACCESMLCSYSADSSKDYSATFWSNVMTVLKAGIKTVYKRTFSPP